ncbi:MAG: TetR/AcrR family transcriptional regulator [Oscillospiraceae bacterium]|nr:TetR/AcrR family transcriptional regulator [Oscillospiraceae bacterium]MBQ4538843.1 TetR/AcrR family transcriptional regulator [Oscillospiraceae bacterium]
MSNYLSKEYKTQLHEKVVKAAAVLFMNKGYTAASTREIAKAAGVQVSAMNRAFGCKEMILCELVSYILEGQLSSVKKRVASLTDDKVIIYTVSSALQLYMAEMNEAVRDMYCNAYSLSETSEMILRKITEQMIAPTFGEYFPEYTMEDFYQLELASGSIIRGYMLVRCSEQFDIVKKVERFLETAFRIYCVPNEKAEEALSFLRKIDFVTLSHTAISDLMGFIK